MVLASGIRLGRYEIRSLIGKGGMGEVYLTQDMELERTVAFKILPADVASNQDRMRRFMQEAKTAAALNHLNIAHIYEIGEIDDINFIAMEFIDGDTLREKIHRDKTDLKKLLGYLTQVATGLAKAHAAGIVHRDLKPDNIMITRDSYAKILDFGLAKLVEPQSALGRDAKEVSTVLMERQTQSGAVMGTVGYMSPEQVRGQAVDQRSDIFSFGCILYEAATGRRPFDGDSAIDTLHKVLYSQPLPIKDFNPEAPADLQRITRRCLAKDPEERYQIAKDVVIELKELCRILDSESEQPLVTPSPNSERISNSSGQMRAEAIKEQTKFTKEIEEARSTSSAKYIVSKIKRHKGLAIIVSTVLIIAITVLTTRINKSANQNQSASQSVVPKVENSESTPNSSKLYRQMTKAEQMKFIEQQAQHISTMLGNTPYTFDFKALDNIKFWVDSYARRVDNGNGDQLWGGDLRFAFQRGERYAPFIIKAFNDQAVPPIIGLYISMIETEYTNICPPNFQGGAKGIFQLLAGTAQSYGFSSNDRCDVSKASQIAARYMYDKLIEWGTDSTNVTFAIYCYNRNPDSVRRDLYKALDSPNKERSFWTLVAEQGKLDEASSGEAINYVPRFFAAAIVGENPQSFGLPIQPLSTYKRETNQTSSNVPTVQD